MLDQIAIAQLAQVKQRASEGDFPTTPALSVESLEDLVIHFAGAARATAAPAGWKLVPEKPTFEMMQAAHNSTTVCTPDGTWRLSRDEAERAYRAMLNASPAAPSDAA